MKKLGKFLSTVIKIRKPNIQQPLPREQGINNGHKVRRQPISQERGWRLSSFVVKRMFTKGDSSLSHIMTSVSGSSTVLLRKKQRTCEKQHEGILLLNIPWQETVADFVFWRSKITADGDCSHKIKRRFLLGRKVMTNLDSIFESRDITLPTKPLVCVPKR